MAQLGPTTIYGDLTTNKDLIALANLIFNVASDVKIYDDGSGNLMFKDSNAGTLSLGDLSKQRIIWLKDKSLTDNTLANLSDATTWNVDKSIIKFVRIVTSATDWDLTIYCDSDESSGMFDSFNLIQNASGDKDLVLDFPVIDNDTSQQVHVKFIDNNASNGATISIYGVEAR